MNASTDIRSITNMTSKGQVLIPKDVREELGLMPGQQVAVGINDRREAVVLPRGATTGETPAERRDRLMAALDVVRADPLFTGPTAGTMADLRGDEPLP